MSLMLEQQPQQPLYWSPKAQTPLQDNAPVALEALTARRAQTVWAQ